MSGRVVETRVLPAGDGLPIAVRTLEQGGLVAFPTDTVYGLGAHAFLPAAVGRIYEAKIRPAGKAIPLLVPDAGGLALVARLVSEDARRLVEAFWPGALTIIVPRADIIPPVVAQGSKSVAVRAPNHPVAQALLRSVGAPLAVTSANISGRPALCTAQEVFAELRGKIDIVLDGGPCPLGVESTIVDVTGARPRIVRRGAIDAASLAAVVALEGNGEVR